jgi:hypothetical protein
MGPLGFTQYPGVDYNEPFIPVVKPAIVRMVLAIAVSRDWPVQQLDVKNAFLHDTLNETVFYSQLTGSLIRLTSTWSAAYTSRCTD